jgi:hypothetical protein
MKEFKLLDRKTSYYYLKEDFKSAYKNNGYNIPLALSQVAKLRDLDLNYVKLILSKYISGIQYKKYNFCPSCKQEWNGIECKHCSFDTGFDPNWDLD